MANPAPGFRTAFRPGRAGVRGAAVALLATTGLLCTTGCGALLLVGGAGTSAIAFATGELRTTEEEPLPQVDAATGEALETLGYDAVEAERALERVRWRARTPSGDPVDVRLIAKGTERTELRIRIGVFGDETRSRLVLEQIRQAL